jgi:hypothetical protein
MPLVVSELVVAHGFDRAPVRSPDVNLIGVADGGRAEKNRLWRIGYIRILAGHKGVAGITRSYVLGAHGVG